MARRRSLLIVVSLQPMMDAQASVCSTKKAIAASRALHAPAQKSVARYDINADHWWEVPTERQWREVMGFDTTGDGRIDKICYDTNGAPRRRKRHDLGEPEILCSSALLLTSGDGSGRAPVGLVHFGTFWYANM